MNKYTFTYIDNRSGQIVYQTIREFPNFQLARNAARSLKSEFAEKYGVDLLHTTPFVKLNRIK